MLRRLRKDFPVFGRRAGYAAYARTRLKLNKVQSARFGDYFATKRHRGEFWTTSGRVTAMKKAGLRTFEVDRAMRKAVEIEGKGRLRRFAGFVSRKDL